MNSTRYFLVLLGLIILFGCASAQVPTAAFSGTPTSGTVPLTVTFTDTSTGTPAGWAWFFGDENYTAPWTEVNASAGWFARDHHTSVVLPDGNIVIMGGNEYNAIPPQVNDTWRSTDGGATWTEMNASSGWPAREAHSSVALPDGHIVLMGGVGYWGVPTLNDTWRSTDEGATWTEMNASSGWTSRYNQNAVALPDGSIVLMGGNDENGLGGDTKDVWRSMDEGATWTEVNATAGWADRSEHTCVAMPDGSILLMGGLTANGQFGDPSYSHMMNDTWRSTDGGATWTMTNASGPWVARRTFSAVALPDDSVVIMGGDTPTNYWLNDSWRSTDFGASWTRLPDPGWSPRYWQTSVAMPNGTIVLMGGIDLYNNLQNDVWSLTTAGSSAQNPTHTYPAPGVYPVALQAYNTNGYNSTLKAGYITVHLPAPTADFSAAPASGTAPLPVSFTDSSSNNPAGWAWFFGDENYTVPWTQVNTSPGWSERWEHSSVVMPDGSIVLMGGYSDVDGYRNDTWRSNDDGLTWTLVNPSSGWAPRSAHSSVVMPDGSIVLMGGEIDSNVRVNDTWRSTDEGATWTLVNASPGWSARFSQSSVAMPDGSILLMGGYSSEGGYQHDVWRSADDGATWTEVNASPGWSPRHLQSSVAMPDGSVLLMGGEHYGWLNDTYRSDDDGATWTLVNASSGWTVRCAFDTVVMPDGSILLMGGVNDYGHLSDVWRSTDNGATWTKVTAGAGWGPRSYQSSVVMPDGSIVLTGGFDGSYKNDVWRLTAAGSTEQNPVHTYPLPGHYTVALQAYNTNGVNVSVRKNYIAVAGPKPVPRFSANITSGLEPLTVSFTDHSLNNPTNWAWYFGDENYTAPWTQMNASSGWQAREDSSSVVMPDGSIVLMGGSSGSIYYNDVWRSTDNGTTWTQQTASAGWSARYDHSSVAMPDGSIVLMGGVDGGSIYYNDVWRSADNGATWTLMNASAGWSPRAGHSSVVMPDGSIVLMGGSYQNDTWRSTDLGKHWTQMSASAGWTAREWHSSVALPDGSIVLMGGDDGTLRNDVWRSTDDGATWSQLPDAGWSRRRLHSSVAMPDGSIVVTGGYATGPLGTGFSQEVWRSADDGATWTQLPDAAWPARYSHSSVAMPDGSIILTGGWTGSTFMNDTWRFQPFVGSSAQDPVHTYTVPGHYTVALQVSNAYGVNASVWTNAISVTGPKPIPRFSVNVTYSPVPLTASFTDHSLNTPTGRAWYFGDENYTQAWTEMNASAPWPARYYQSAVAMPDGSIVMMGGWNGASAFNDVWRSTDNGASWTEMTSGAGWSPRCYFSSVAMPDNSIILMGGWNGYGGIYNDVWWSTDDGATWTEVNASAGWTTRYGHSSVVMPDGSIVLMGGYPYTNDVWRSTDYGATWTEMNASAGWTPRYYHTSVAMPDGSIVLMGGDTGGLVNDVWRSADNGITWTEMNASAGWTPRYFHTSVAMPDGSIVLMGGYTLGIANDVWRSADDGATWTLVNASAGWPVRYSHSSVAMPDGSVVLLGGYPSTNDVWRFTPAGSSEQDPLHTFTTPGTYPVVLQAYNSYGPNSTRRNNYIHAVKRSRWVPSGGTVAIGESGLDITACTDSNSSISWWSEGMDISSTPPNMTIDISSLIHNFTVSRSEFAGRTGAWYSGDGSSGTPPLAFQVVAPVTEIQIRDITINSTDVTGKTVPVGDELGFRITTTITGIITERGMQNGIPFNITLIGPDGTQLPSVINMTGGTVDLTDIRVPSSPYDTGGIWNTGNALYRNGTYTVRVGATLNSMGDASPDRTITLSRTPAPVLPAPVISSIPTGSGFRNSTTAFTIIGSNFEPGTGNTTVEFRNQSTGMIATTLTNITATRIDGTVVIPENATAGSWNIRVVTVDGGENTKLNAFSIQNLSRPVVTSITPTSGVRTSLVTFTMAGTNFQPGTGNTNVTLYNQTYPGLIIARLTTVTATSITGNFTIPADAAFGKWFVNVTTVSGGTSTSLVTFTVTQQLKPAITSITPATGFRNRTLTVALAGSNFQVGTGSNVSFFNQTYFTTNATLIYANVTGVTSTGITARVFFPDDAPVGSNSWLVNVTTVDGGTSTTNNPFTLLKPVPTITGGITPLTGVRTDLITFTLGGTNFQPGPGNTTVTLFNTTYGGVITAQLTSVTPTAITGNFTIPVDAAFGKWFANVTTTDGGTSTSLVTFTVTQQLKPAITSITPATGFRNRTLTVALAGSNFQVGTGSNVSFFNQSYFDTNSTRIYANVMSVTSTAIMARVFFPDDAPVGSNSWIVNVTTVDGGTSTSPVTFTLLKPVPTITGSIAPATGVRTDLITFTLGGTNFQPGPGNTTVTLFNTTYGGIITARLGSVTPTAITGNFTIPADAAFGKWFVNVTTTDGGTSTSPVTFTVTQQLKPAITSITPATGFRNRTLTVALAGTGFQVGTGSNVSFFNQSYFDTNSTRIYANVMSVTSTAIMARVFFPDDAPVGSNSWIVNVTTVDGGTSTTNNPFTLLKPVPTITGSIAPATGVRTDLITFTLGGTNFQPGPGNTTVTLFNTTYGGVITAQLSSVTPTAITGNFTIPADAAFGKWFVNVTTVDGGTSTSLVPFTVTQQLKPAITSITPATGFRNRTLTVSLAGSNFQVGTGSNVSFFNQTYFTTNATLIYANVTSVTSTAIMARVLFPDDAPVGLNSWLVNVTTVDGGTSTSPVTFTLLKPVPTISSMTPLTGARTGLVTFTLGGTNFQPGIGNTTVTLYNQTYFNAHNDNVTAQLTSVTPTTITGNFTVPPDSPFGKIWTVNVTTLDGGTSTSRILFTEIRQAPTIRPITPNTGYHNDTVSFTITGTNFQPGLTTVRLSHRTYGELESTLYSVSSTQIIGGIQIPPAAPADTTWKFNVSTADGGVVQSPFEVKNVPPPGITSFIPATLYRDTTVAFTLQGTSFQTGGRTVVNLTNTTGYNITTTLSGVYPTTITGTVALPADAVAGSWKVNVTTLDGGMNTKITAVSIL
jgi:PKD repeat protein